MENAEKGTYENTARTAGKAFAKLAVPVIMEAIRTGKDRYQASWALRNMIRALEIHSYKNTPVEWNRYYEARIILMARKYGRMTESMKKELA